MITLKRAVELLTARRKRFFWRAPRNVLAELRMLSRHACETGCASDGSTSANTARVDWGAVGATSGRPVLGLLQTPPASALALRNERSSRKNTSRFLPQRKLR